MPKEYRNELILLHEITHGITPRECAFHGSEFCGCYLKVVRTFMGDDFFVDLRYTFNRLGIKYQSTTTVPGNGL